MREATSYTPTVSFDRVCFDFDGKSLFHDLSLTLEGGHTTCILGPSGCGKSTLLKLIAGVAPLPFEGTIRFTPETTESRKVAWMGQNDLLLPWLSLLDNVLLGARLRQELDMPLQSKAMALIAEAGMAGYEHALPATLSGGMRQRAALLRTLMEERQILLMDEPFSALDALTRVRLQNLAARLTHGATVILVTHDPLEALRLGDRIIVLAGTPIRVVETLTPEGQPPRAAGNASLSRQYGQLLELLMQGERA
jgi:putative hydroxymethylpyrimidine transport system ATP-binding protein